MVIDLNVSNWKKVEDRRIMAENSYLDAKQYFAAAKLLENEQKGDNVFAPVLTNIAFACELFCKALLYNIPEEKVAGHKLYELYGKLPEEIRNTIQKEEHFIDKFNKELNEVSEIFERWRYRYEYTPNNCNYYFIFKLAEKLNDVADASFRDGKNGKQNIENE